MARTPRRSLTAKNSGVEIDAGVFSLGRASDANDDFSGVMSSQAAKESPRGWLAVVADGVSSSQRGRDAAHTSGEALFADFQSVPVGWDTTVALDRIISAQNEWMWRQNQALHASGMETTLTALVVGSRYFTVAHIGDCRCYLLRANRLFQLTQDHIRLSDGGQRGPLTRALGLDDRVLVDYRQEPVQLDDSFLLLSDGIWSVVPDRQLQQIAIEAPDAQNAAEQLCRAAAARGTTDDASAVVMRVLDWTAHDLPLPDEIGVSLPLPTKLKPGEQIDGLTVERLVMDDAVSRVYQVRDPSTQAALAMKTLARGRGGLIAERENIAREHWLCAHAPASAPRAIMPREAPSAFYYLFEWIEGQTLAEIAKQAPRIELIDWTRLAQEALRAVAALHRHGIIHRDIKPENLVREADGQVRVIDLGVAVTRRKDDRASGEPAGTPAYINPEQWKGDPPNERSDIFALGVTLFHLLTRALPYGEIQPYQTPPYERDPVAATQLRPDVPRWVDHWLARAYGRREAERYETVDEMLLALERAAQSGSLPAPEPAPLIRRGTTGLLWIALTLSLLLNVLLIALALIL